MRSTTLLHAIDRIIIYIFAVEIALKILSKVRRPWDFFKDPWNVFDFIIVGVCFLPSIDTHYVAVLLMARVLRVFRMITLFKVLTLEGWTDIMNIQFYGTTDPMAEYTSKPISYASNVYFVPFILIGAMIVMNLFIGVIMNSMQESHMELEKEKKPAGAKSDRAEDIIRELNRKIDDLKNDPSILKDRIK